MAAVKARSRATIPRRRGLSQRWERRRGITSAPTSTSSSAGSKDQQFTEARNPATDGKPPGESKNDASDTHNTNSSKAQPAGEAHRETGGEARHREECKTGASAGEGSSGSAGAGALQAVQAGLGGDRRADCECAGHAVCLPVLPEVAPRSRAGTRVQEDAAGTMGPLAASGGIGNRWHA